jgi:hypothetical protein
MLSYSKDRRKETVLNKNKLKGKIAETGQKQGQILAAAGMDYVGFWRKMKGYRDFTRRDIESLSRVLNLTPTERDEIFFAL